MRAAAISQSLEQWRRSSVSWLGWRAARPTGLAVSAWRATLGKRAKLIAVTGSFGKTTTTRAVAAVLGQSTRLERVPNAFTRMYFHAVRQMSREPVGVLEIGIGHPNQMRAYARAVRPQIAVVTSIGWEHELYFPDGLEGIRAEKAELVKALPADGVAVLNHDDERVMWMAQRTRARVLTFGHHPASDVAVVGIEPGITGTVIRLRVHGAEYSVRTALIGAVAATPVAAAVAVAIAIGTDVRQAIRALEALPPTERRLEPVRLSSGAVALLDDLKGTPPTALAAFDAVARIPCGRRVAVLGKIPLSTPEPTEPIYRELGRHAARVFDRVIFIHLEDHAYDVYRQGALGGGLVPERMTRARTVQEAAHALEQELNSGDVLLLKGHSTDHLSRIVKHLEGESIGCRLQSCRLKTSCDTCRFLFKDIA